MVCKTPASDQRICQLNCDIFTRETGSLLTASSIQNEPLTMSFTSVWSAKTSSIYSWWRESMVGGRLGARAVINRW